MAWQIHKRNGVWNDTAGKETFEEASREVSAFLYLCEKYPQLKFDINAPFWRPLAVVSAKGLAISRESHKEKGETYELNQKVITSRRFPYTVNRLDEYIETIYPTTLSVAGIDELRRKWGLESNDQMFCRAVNRLGTASRILYEAEIFHGQTFKIFSEGLYKGSGFFNFNNIAIDGSIGDMGDAAKVLGDENETYPRDQIWEACGNMVMYLAFVQRVNPRLLGNKDFIGRFIHAWKAGLGKDMSKEMLEPQTEENIGRGNAVDVVAQCVDRTVRFFSSNADTGPYGDLNPTGYLDNTGKNIWMPALSVAMNKIREYGKNLEL